MLRLFYNRVDIWLYCLLSVIAFCCCGFCLFLVGLLTMLWSDGLFVFVFVVLLICFEVCFCFVLLLGWLLC